MFSIRIRLTLFYALGSFLLLSLIAFFLYLESINVLYKADYRFLADEVARLQYIAHGKNADMMTLKKEIIAVPHDSDSIYQYYIRLFDDKQTILAETPNMKKVLPIKIPTELLRAERIRNYFWHSSAETNYLVIQSPIYLQNKNKKGLIQIALDVSYQHNVIHDKTNFLFILLLGTLGALFIGMIIANRGMSSLYVLTERVEKITSSSLSERVNPKSWPIELASLGNAFNRMLDRFEVSFIRLKQFAADLAHELRTPINNLIGETEVALTYVDSKAAYQEVLESNLEELHRLNQLIENILFLAKTDNRNLSVEKTAICVRDEIAILTDYYQALADDKNITISCAGDDVIMHANPIMFRRMLSNLLSNAIKYTQHDGQIFFQLTRNHHTFTLTIKDTGIGIAKENHQQIFDRFFRVDASRTQETQGVGLGLAIVKSIVELHHGSIELESELNQGTSIQITFNMTKV